MMYDFGKTAAQSIGVMVVEVFPSLHQRKFIQAACPNDPFPRHAKTLWKDSDKRPPAIRSEIPFFYGKTRIREYLVHLFSFPNPLSMDFHLQELRFPVELSGLGFVVILDMPMLLSLPELHKVSEWAHLSNAPLGWVIAHELPYVVVAKWSDEIPGDSTEELCRIFGLDPKMPICHSSSEFDTDLVDRVLCILLDQFWGFTTR